MRRSITKASAPTPYERAALRDARDAFANPRRTPVSAAAHLVACSRRKPMSPAALETLRREGAAVFATATAGALALNELAATTVRPHAVWAAFRKHGLTTVQGPEDVQRLALWEVDEVADRLRTKYLLAAAGVGTLALASGSLLTLDAPVVAGLAMRAIHDHALHYGFDVRDPEERAFALKVFLSALVPGASARDVALEQAHDAALLMRRAWRRKMRRTWGLPFALHVGSSLLRRDAGLPFVRRLVAVAVAGLNAWLLHGVVETAQAAYRQRFLARARAEKARPALAPAQTGASRRLTSPLAAGAR